MVTQGREVAGYRMLRQVGYDGAGGFGLGHLYEAVDRAGHHVALKIASVEALPQVLVKAHNQHPNLVELLGFWIIDGNGQIVEGAPEDAAKYTSPEAYLAIATNVYEGNSIPNSLGHLQKGGSPTIPLPELLNLMGSIAQGIDFLTRPKHIERLSIVALHSFEVTPSNIRVTRERALFDDIDAGVYSQVQEEPLLGTVVGYPKYMAPERFKGTSCPQSVQYSFAVTYHKLRTGTLPFAVPEDPMTDFINARMENRLDLSRLPRAERLAIQKALSHNPEERYESCGDLVQNLRGAVRLLVPAGASSITNVDLVQNLRSAVRRRRWWQFWG